MKLMSNPLINALAAVCRWFDEKQIPYMVFGGVANSLHGDPRQTFDIDIKLHLQASLSQDEFIRVISDIAVIIPDRPEEFISNTGVLPVDVCGVRIDLVFASLPFEISAIERSRRQSVYGFDICVCTPEDLIIHKAVSTRPKDWIDIEQLISRKKDILDWDYLLKHCGELAKFLDRPDIIQKIVDFKNE